MYYLLRSDRLLGLDVDLRATAALVSLGGDDLVVVLAEVQALASPGVEVSLHVDAATDTLSLADGPVLVEGLARISPAICALREVTYLGAIDGGLVVTGGLGDGVGSAVGLEGTKVLSSAAGIVGAERLDNVVLYERVASPAVDSEVAVTLGVEGTAVVDGAEISR